MKTKKNPTRARIHIDGSRGEGGGQILRTALSLSAITGRGFRIDKIRAGRKRPGLLRQHLACARAVAEICDAHAEGLQMGSESLTFNPGRNSAFSGEFEIGSAGSTGLLLQTVLPVLLHAGEESLVRFGGGTHAIQAPCFHYLDEVFLPKMAEMGAKAELNLHRHGFFPAGGGRVELRVQPSALNPIFGSDPVEKSVEGAEILTTPQIPAHVVEREVAALRKGLSLSDEKITVTEIGDSICPGNVVMIRAGSSGAGTLVVAYAERGKKAERVVSEAVSEAKRYLSSPASVDKYLADQLLLPLALSEGGEFLATGLTPHFQTNVETIEAFLPVKILSEKVGEQSWQITIIS